MQVVLKCIKKAKYDGCVLNESECLAREVLIHGQVVHHINRPLAAGMLYWLLTY